MRIYGLLPSLIQQQNNTSSSCNRNSSNNPSMGRDTEEVPAQSRNGDGIGAGETVSTDLSIAQIFR